jgi:hypothetical protein
VSWFSSVVLVMLLNDAWLLLTKNAVMSPECVQAMPHSSVAHNMQCTKTHILETVNIAHCSDFLSFDDASKITLFATRSITKQTINDTTFTHTLCMSSSVTCALLHM